MNQTTPPTRPATLGLACLARVFWRSLAIQTAWNPAGMQNLGLAHALWPAFEALYPDAAARREALRRHLTPFNTHPYLAAAIVGGVLHLEERVARGEMPASRVDTFKALLMGPLAALGDGFFWRSLRPAFGALAILLAFGLGIVGVLIALALYNAVHLSLRLRLFQAGYRHGEGVLELIARWRFDKRRDATRRLSAAFVGAFAALVSLAPPAFFCAPGKGLPVPESSPSPVVSTALAWLVGLLALTAARANASPRAPGATAILVSAGAIAFCVGLLL